MVAGHGAQNGKSWGQQKNQNNMKITLLGGGGFIGSYLAGEFESRGHQVTIYDAELCFSDAPEDIQKKSIAYRAKLHKTGIIHKSIDEIKPLDFIGNRPDIIIMLAGAPIDKPESERLSKYQIEKDIAYTYHAINLAKAVPEARFVYMSSIFAYGDFDWSANETQALNPKTPYGITKAVGEFFTKLHLTNWNIIRTTSVYGMGDWNWRATQILINRAMRNEPIWVNETWLDFIHVQDLVQGIADVALSDKKNEAFHISGGKALNLLDYAELLKKYFPNLNYDTTKVQDRPKRGTIDNTKARMLLGWEPKYTLETGLDQYMTEVLREGFA